MIYLSERFFTQQLDPESFSCIYLMGYDMGFAVDGYSASS